MRSDGDLNTCGYCGRPLSIVDGTDPDDANGEWSEQYECPNGHTGRYKWDHGTERYSGACTERLSGGKTVVGP